MPFIDRWCGTAAQQLRPLLSSNMSLWDRLILVTTFAMLSTWLRWWFVAPWLVYMSIMLLPVVIQLYRATMLGGVAMFMPPDATEPLPLIDYLTGLAGETTDNPEP